MTDEPQAEHAEPVELAPTEFLWVCPQCGFAHEGITVEEDDAGIYFVPAEDRFQRCPNCDCFVELLALRLEHQAAGALPYRARGRGD